MERQRAQRHFITESLCELCLFTSLRETTYNIINIGDEWLVLQENYSKEAMQ